MSSLSLDQERRLDLYKNGQIFWNPMGAVKTKCLPNLHLFPFDTQICDIRFESWNYPNYEMNLFPNQTEQAAFIKFDEHWSENPQWLIVDNATISKRQKDPEGFCFTFIVHRIIIKRKPLYQIITIILPCMIISATETVVFYLPCNDPTRVQISVTCLLAFTIFQSMIMQTVPRAIDSVPLVSLYIGLQMFYIGFIAIIGDAICFSILNSDFHREPPSEKLLNTFGKIGQSVGIPNHFHTCKTLELNLIKVINDADDEMVKIREIFDKWRDFTVKRKLDKQWLFIAQVLQRLILIVYATLIVFTPVAIMVAIVTTGDEINFKQYQSDC